MKSNIIAAILIVSILFAACGCSQKGDKIISTEKLSDTSSIITSEVEYKGLKGAVKNIKYSWDGEEFENYFDERMRGALSWIKENTNESAKFLCWWDYGHMIRGFAGRDSVIYYPSEDILDTLANKGEGIPKDQLMPHDVVIEVAHVLVGKSRGFLKDTMKLFSADYFLVTKNDLLLKNTLANISDTEISDEAMMNLALDGELANGFRQVYRDNFVVIYHLDW